MPPELWVGGIVTAIACAIGRQLVMRHMALRHVGVTLRRISDVLESEPLIQEGEIERYAPVEGAKQQRLSAGDLAMVYRLILTKEGRRVETVRTALPLSDRFIEHFAVHYERDSEGREQVTGWNWNDVDYYHGFERGDHRYHADSILGYARRASSIKLPS